MYDSDKIGAGLLVFLILITLPVWYNGVRGAIAVPQPKIVTEEKHCIEDAEIMRAEHLQILDEWRDSVVRQGERMYTSKTYGMPYEMSIEKECKACHPNKQEFCDECHDYVGVKPYCWNCHNY